MGADASRCFSLFRRLDQPEETLAAPDGQRIAHATELRLTATARTANSNMQWNEKWKSLTSWGQVPMVIEPVTGKVVLRNLARAKSVSVQALDGAGKALGSVLLAQKKGDDWVLSLATGDDLVCNDRQSVNAAPIGKVNPNWVGTLTSPPRRDRGSVQRAMPFH